MTFAIHQIISGTDTKYEFTINGLVGPWDDSTLIGFFKGLMEEEYKISVYTQYINLEDYNKDIGIIDATITTLYEQTYHDSSCINLSHIKSIIETNYPELFI